MSGLLSNYVNTNCESSLCYVTTDISTVCSIQSISSLCIVTVVLVCVNSGLLLCNVGNFGGATVKFNSLHYYQENGSIARQEDVVKFGIRGLLEAKGIVIRKTVKKGVFHDFQLC